MIDDGSRRPTILQLLNSPRFYGGIVVLAAILAVIAVFGGRGGFRSTTEPLPPVAKVDRIAYVGLDARVRSVNPDGSDPIQISRGEGFFTWPTWSPDARSLVFSSVITQVDGSTRISLFAADAISGELDELYVGEPGVAGLLAQGVVHYPLWAPDSSRVAFIAVTSRGLTLFVDDLEDEDGADLILDQGPLWISWSPDSRYLLAHRGNDHYLVDTEGQIGVSQLQIPAAPYRVPAWEPTGGSIIVASQDERGREFLTAARLAGDRLASTQSIIEVASNPAFLWSPDGRFLAVGRSPRYMYTEGGVVLVNQRLSILPGGNPENALEVDDEALAHFWSPDSTKLAYVTITRSRGVLRWMILDVYSGERWPLIEFVPSPDQLTMLQFFDQYAYSHSLWSPDSRALVFSGNLETGSMTASYRSHPGHAEPHIIVVGTGRNPAHQFIADGILGFWSPR